MILMAPAAISKTVSIGCAKRCIKANVAHLFDGTHWADKTCEEIDCPNFSVFDLGACCVEDADGGMICYFVKETDCESYGGVWYPGIPCECEPCDSIDNLNLC